LENVDLLIGHLEHFGICCDHLVHFVFIWYIYLVTVPSKIWQPCSETHDFIIAPKYFGNLCTKTLKAKNCPNGENLPNLEKWRFPSFSSFVRLQMNWGTFSWGWWPASVDWPRS
jgi:hypothetical protein